MPVYVQIASGVFALVVCGTPFLSGCGFVSRIQAWDTNQRIKANSGVARTAITEHLETQQLLGGVGPLSVLPSVLQVPTQSAEALELIEHNRSLGRLRRAHEVENAIRKQDLLRKQLTQSHVSLDATNGELLKQFVSREYGIISK